MYLVNPKVRELLVMVHAMVEAQDHVSDDFDAEIWLNSWIETPQPALGGRTPSDLLESDDGLEIVRRLLGAAASGAYQ